MTERRHFISVTSVAYTLSMRKCLLSSEKRPEECTCFAKEGEELHQSVNAGDVRRSGKSASRGRLGVDFMSPWGRGRGQPLVGWLGKQVGLRS